MWENGTNGKYRMVARKIGKLGQMDWLAKCIYFVLTEYRFLISQIDQYCSMELDNNMGMVVQYWYDIGILEILVWDCHVGIMALCWQIKWVLLL